MTDQGGQTSGPPGEGDTLLESRARPRPTDLPVDVDAVMASADAVDQLARYDPRRAVEAEVYRRMIQVRHNARRVPVEQWDRAEVAEHIEVLTTTAYIDELVPKDARVEPAETAVADLLAVMRSRRSARTFSDQELPEEHLGLVLEAARWAPSAGNSQPWELLVVREPDAKRAISEALDPAISMLRHLDPTFPGFANPRYLQGAAALILVLGDIRTTAAYPYPLPPGPRTAMLEQSLAMCVQNMWLMATRLGLVATNYTMGDPSAEARIFEHFGVPEHFTLPTMLVLGYPKHPQSPRPRRAQADFVHRERFDAERVRSDEELIDFFYARGVRGRGFR